MSRNGQQGFTLLELMTVVAVLGILATFAFPSVTRILNRQAAKASATQVAGLLESARNQAVAEGTPHLVYFDAPVVGEDGECTAMATEVRDADHSYSITPGDGTREFQLEGRACKAMKPVGADPNEPPEVASAPLPLDDLTARAADAVEVAAARVLKDAKARAPKPPPPPKPPKGKGGPVPTEETPTEAEAPEAPRTSTVAETAVNGATFPVDAEGRPVVAFSERGIPVDPSHPTEWGSGAGGLYLTDGESTVVGAVVAPLGDVQLRLFDAASATWQ